MLPVQFVIEIFDFQMYGRFQELELELNKVTNYRRIAITCKVFEVVIYNCISPMIMHSISQFTS